jgi:hypothetical protein
MLMPKLSRRARQYSRLCSLHSPIGWRQVFEIALNRRGSSLSELSFDIDDTDYSDALDMAEFEVIVRFEHRL